MFKKFHKLMKAGRLSKVVRAVGIENDDRRMAQLRKRRKKSNRKEK